MTQLEIENPISIIKGRVDPQIYAFRTHTVPDYVKIGDTTRSVNERLNEWRNYFQDLEHLKSWTAKTENGKYFRDLSIHEFLELYAPTTHLRLTPEILREIETKKGTYFSREFFKNVEISDIIEAIDDINSYATQEGQTRYKFYSEDNLPKTETYERKLVCKKRKLQLSAIKNFKKAYKRGANHLLMYAIMRFGKSITSMLCAKAMNAKVVLVVSAKVDVCSEWKYTTEAFKDFEGYKFLTQKDLRTSGIIKKTLSGKEVSQANPKEKYNKAVIFVSLQDLSGTKADGSLKEKFEELYDCKIDLMIVDETHYGARGASYGKPIANKEKGAYDESLDDLNSGLSLIKKEYHLSPKVQLHLSGTPYRILMGSEFKEEDIICKCQYTDIVKAKEEWDADNLTSDNPDENNDKAGDNPYFGFPQMIRFAFSPNDSARKWMEEEKKYGRSCSLDDLFKPLEEDSKEAKTYHFAHEKEVLDLLRAIDGCQKDKNILDILNLQQIKDGHLCHHMVMVLPLRASCDAMVQLLNDHKEEFINLRDYELINIAGKTKGKEMDKSNYVDIVKQRIKQAEKEERKTIVLTVGRMLTGVTVPEWDTMLFMKEASSPQEYDQAIFRLQSPYVCNRPNEDGSYTKFDMKPQTLLVDFDVNRMFYLQAQKSLIFNINTEKRGKEELEERIKEELAISPVLMMNIKDGKLKQAEPQDVIDAVRNYSSNISLQDEAVFISDMFDFSLIQNEALKAIANKYKEIDAKDGFSQSAYKDKDGDPRTPHEPDSREESSTDTDNKPKKQKERSEEEQIKMKLANFISRIYFFALLTDTPVKNLKEVVEAINKNKDNKRIAKNVNLQYDDAKEALKILRENKSSTDYLNEIDNKIQNVREIINDSTITNPVERVTKAMRKFGRLSEAEIVTPSRIANDMVNLIPKKDITSQTRFLDIASKEGEFACALYDSFGPTIKDNIYAVPTSSLAYEFTRKVFELLGIPAENVIADFNSYNLIKSDNKELFIKQLKNMKFDVIVGNPPYQLGVGNEGGNHSKAKSIYHLFLDNALQLAHNYIVMIMPSRWMTRTAEGISDEWIDHTLSNHHFRNIHDFEQSTDCFPNVSIMGGVNYFLWDNNYNGKCEYIYHIGGKIQKYNRYLDSLDTGFVVRDSISIEIIHNIAKKEGCYYSIQNNNFSDLVSPKDYFSTKQKLTSSWLGYSENKDDEHFVKYYVNPTIHHRDFGWISMSQIPKNIKATPLHKVLIASANGAALTNGQIISTPFYAGENCVCSQTYLVIGYDPLRHNFSEEECVHIVAYMKTRFFRFLVNIKKKTQNGPRGVYQFVPLQDFTTNSDIDWSQSVADIDKQLYKKYHLSPDEIAFIESTIKPM